MVVWYAPKAVDLGEAVGAAHWVGGIVRGRCTGVAAFPGHDDAQRVKLLDGPANRLCYGYGVVAGGDRRRDGRGRGRGVNVAVVYPNGGRGDAQRLGEASGSPVQRR